MAEQQEMVCPNCHSDNIQKYEVAYLNGTSVSSSTTAGVGFAGSMGVGAAKTNTTTQNHMAAITAPPAKKGYFKKFILYFILGMIITLLIGNVIDIVGQLSFILSIIFAGYMVYKQCYLWNKNEWPKLMDTWNHSYVCLKCGTHFTLP